MFRRAVGHGSLAAATQRPSSSSRRQRRRRARHQWRSSNARLGSAHRRRLCHGVLRRNAHADDTHRDAQTRVSKRLAGL